MLKSIKTIFNNSRLILSLMLPLVFTQTADANQPPPSPLVALLDYHLKPKDPVTEELWMREQIQHLSAFCSLYITAEKILTYEASNLEHSSQQACRIKQLVDQHRALLTQLRNPRLGGIQLPFETREGDAPLISALRSGSWSPLIASPDSGSRLGFHLILNRMAISQALIKFRTLLIQEKTSGRLNLTTSLVLPRLISFFSGHDLTIRTLSHLDHTICLSNQQRNCQTLEQEASQLRLAIMSLIKNSKITLSKSEINSVTDHDIKRRLLLIHQLTHTLSILKKMESHDRLVHFIFKEQTDPLILKTQSLFEKLIDEVGFDHLGHEAVLFFTALSTAIEINSYLQHIEPITNPLPKTNLTTTQKNQEDLTHRQHKLLAALRAELEDIYFQRINYQIQKENQ